MGELERLPGTRFTPTVALHRLLQRVDTIKGLVIIEIDNNDNYDAVVTAMQNSELCMASVVLNAYVQKAIYDKVGESPPPERA